MTTEDAIVSPGVPAHRLRVFLSSGDDAGDLRDRVDALRDVFNQQLYEVKSVFMIHVDRWERTSAQKVGTGNVNDLFVTRARESDLTLVLLMGNLGPGTKEEIEAVLEQGSTPDLAILWFKPVGAAEEELVEFIEEIKADVLIKEIEPGQEDDGWLAMTEVLLRLILRAAAHPTNS